MMAPVRSKYTGLSAKIRQELESWLDTIADQTAAAALKEMAAHAEPPGLGLHPEQAAKKLHDWLTPMVTIALAIGAEARKVAFEGLFFRSGIPGALVELSRSHKASLNREKVVNPKGAKRAIWRQRLMDEVLNDSRFMAKVINQRERAPVDLIIGRAEQLRIIDTVAHSGDPEERHFIDYETGKRIASGRPALSSAISKIKKELISKNP